MTVSTTTARVAYSGNGSTQVFSMPVYFLAASDLSVYLTSLGVTTKQVITTDYTVSGAANPAGGSVTMLTAPATGETLTIIREPDQTQPTDYQANDPFPAETHERALDRLTMISQHLQDQINRTFRVDVSEAGATFPAPAANRVIGWDSAGVALENKTATTAIAVDVNGAVSQSAGGTGATSLGAALVTPTGGAEDSLADHLAALYDETDPIAGFGATAADNAAEAAAIVAAHPGEMVDLAGLTIPITAVPDGDWFNGYWAIANAEGDLTVSYPARDTLPRTRVALSSDHAYFAWAQDNAHVIDGVVWLLATVGKSHGDAPNNMVSMRLENGDWRAPVPHLVAYDQAYWVSAAGSLDGLQLAFRRRTDDADYDLYSRRARSLRVETTDTIRTTSGSDKFQVFYADLASQYRGLCGVRIGDTVYFDGVDIVGGLTISGGYTVSDVTATYIEFDHASNAASTATGGGEFAMTFREHGFSEVQVDSLTVGAAIQAGRTGSTQSNLHSFAPGDQHSGVAYVGVGRTTTAVKAGIAKLSGLFGSTPTVDWWRAITGANTAHTEPTIWRDPSDGYLYGFLRSQLSTVAPGFFWSDDDMVTATVTTGTGNEYMWNSPISLVGVGDNLYAVASASRTGPGSDTGNSPETVAIYYGTATKTAARSSGFAAFQWIEVDTVYYRNQFYGQANAIGVPSITADGDMLHLFYGGEATGATSVTGSSADAATIFHMQIPLSPERIAYQPQVAPHDFTSVEMRGLPATAEGDPLIFETVIFDLLGLYDTTTGYFTAPQTGRYEFSVQVRYSGVSGTERYLTLRDDADVDATGLVIAGASTSGTGATDAPYGSQTFRVPLVEGEKVRLVATQAGTGIVDSTARNHLMIRKVQ